MSKKCQFWSLIKGPYVWNLLLFTLTLDGLNYKYVRYQRFLHDSFCSYRVFIYFSMISFLILWYNCIRTCWKYLQSLTLTSFLSRYDIYDPRNPVNERKRKKPSKDGKQSVKWNHSIQDREWTIGRFELYWLPSRLGIAVMAMQLLSGKRRGHLVIMKIDSTMNDSESYQ